MSRQVNEYVSSWDDIRVGDMITCSGGGGQITALVCEKVEADTKNSLRPLRLLVLYVGNGERYTLFENDITKGNTVKLVWEANDLQKRIKTLEV